MQAMEEVDKSFDKGSAKDKHFAILGQRLRRAFIACAAIFFLLFSINAYAEGKIFEIIVEKYRECSGFFFGDENHIKFDDFSVNINYIPPEFKFEKSGALLDTQAIRYISETGGKLTFLINLNNQKYYLNTEGAEVQELYIDDVKSYLWTKDDYSYLVSIKKGINYAIYGKFDKNELLKINENMEIIKK